MISKFIIAVSDEKSIEFLATKMVTDDLKERQKLVARDYHQDSRRILLNNIEKGKSTLSPKSWRDKKTRAFHTYVIDHWDEISGGDVINLPEETEFGD